MGAETLVERVDRDVLLDVLFRAGHVTTAWNRAGVTGVWAMGLQMVQKGREKARRQVELTSLTTLSSFFVNYGGKSDRSQIQY